VHVAVIDVYLLWTKVCGVAVYLLCQSVGLVGEGQDDILKHHLKGGVLCTKSNTMSTKSDGGTPVGLLHVLVSFFFRIFFKVTSLM